MSLTNAPPRFGVNLVRLAHVSVLVVLVSVISDGLYLGVSLLGALTVFLYLQRHYNPRLQQRVAELHAATDQHLVTGDLERLRDQIRRWHWLCYVGCAGDVYDAWGRLCSAEEEPRLALNYFQRSLRAGSSNRSLDTLVRMVKIYASLDEIGTSETLAVQLLKQNPNDLFLRHRLEMILGDERIAQIA